ncbi:hypothetical protein [Methylobacterium nigriterrae]|uniref:hypothetical protein n=1 Tax=Methylobacterium nigriterrae TaxID=3127512 RepID=UPI0030136CC0
MTHDDQNTNRIAWARIAAILGVDEDDASTRGRCEAAAAEWRDLSVSNVVPSADLKNDLAEIAVVSIQLARKLEKVRDHAAIGVNLVSNDLPISLTDDRNPFADQHLFAIVRAGVLCKNIAAKMKTPRGPKGDAGRRISWEIATRIYEEKTKCQAGFGRTADQSSINGPWVEFMKVFSVLAFPKLIPDLAAFDAFLRARAKMIKRGLDPIDALVFGG